MLATHQRLPYGARASEYARVGSIPLLLLYLRLDLQCRAPLDRLGAARVVGTGVAREIVHRLPVLVDCLLYTSDAADE